MYKKPQFRSTFWQSVINLNRKSKSFTNIKATAVKHTCRSAGYIPISPWPSIYNSLCTPSRSNYRPDIHIYNNVCRYTPHRCVVCTLVTQRISSRNETTQNTFRMLPQKLSASAERQTSFVSEYVLPCEITTY